MGIDRPDDANLPSPERPDPPPDRPRFETRDRQEYYDLHASAAPQNRAEPATQPKPESNWEQTAELSRWMWTEYKRKWPPEERPPVDRSTDPPGSWRSETNRFLNPPDNKRVDTECDRIVSREQQTITPAMREVEAQDPHRHLIGFEHRVKGRDRVKEKVSDNMKALTVTADEAISMVADAIRYTFKYEEAHYSKDVRTDITRLRDQGFNMDRLKNYWLDEEYKGINSYWAEPETGQRFEVQFHTRISYEAKQITHLAYERLRAGRPDKFEQMVLEAFQKKVAAEVPIPPGATDIPDYPKRGTDAR